MSVTTRLYPTVNAAPYSPATFRGPWTNNTNGTGYLEKTPSSASGAQTSLLGTSGPDNFKFGLRRSISDGLAFDYTFTTSDTIDWAFSVAKAGTANFMFTYVYVYVTQGDSDTPRGVLYDGLGNNSIGWPTNPSFSGRQSNPTNLAGTVNALAGDRIVIEMGYQENSAGITPSYTGYVYYGYNGTPDLTGSDAITTHPSWMQLTTTDLIFPARVNVSDSTTLATTTSLSHNPKLIDKSDSTTVASVPTIFRFTDYYEPLVVDIETVATTFQSFIVPPFWSISKAETVSVNATPTILEYNHILFISETEIENALSVPFLGQLTNYDSMVMLL